jgi:hypothetical protein
MNRSPMSNTRTSSTRGIAQLAIASSLVAVATLALGGCDEKSSADTARVKIGGSSFLLELALDNAKRFRGLSERTYIAPDGGMLFVFPEPVPGSNGFVMRDCPIPIDIIYLNGSGRVVSMHAMLPEPPRDPAKGEGTPQDPNNATYNARLKQYTAKGPYQFVIELAGGKLQTLSVKEGDLIEFDRAAVLKRAR